MTSIQTAQRQDTGEINSENEEFLLPAPILDIAAKFTEPEIKNAILKYAKAYFKTLDNNDSYLLNARRDEALDWITELSQRNPQLQEAIINIETAGLASHT